jgi:hypothetical protein
MGITTNDTAGDRAGGGRMGVHHPFFQQSMCFPIEYHHICLTDRFFDTLQLIFQHCFPLTLIFEDTNMFRGPRANAAGFFF